MPAEPRPEFVTELARRRWAVLGVSLAVLVAKLVVAVETFGTSDINHWRDFSDAVRAVGPIRVYGAPMPNSLYNHPPLIGYFLEIVNVNEHLGIPLKVTIRATASIADVVTALVVFELVRRRRSLRDATACALVVALSPVLFMVSAFHANTDPVFTMLALLSVYLLVDRAAPAWSGAVLGLALGVKIVPIVVVPCLLVFAYRSGRRELVRFAGALGLVLLVTWGPAVGLEWTNVKAKVLEYAGLGPGQWGLVQFGHWLGDPGWVGWLKGPGRSVVVAACALVPAVAVWRRPSSVVTAAAVSLVMFFALSPAFAMQYFAWPAAASAVLGLWRGIAYNLVGGALVVEVYTRWAGGFPWTTRLAYYSPLTDAETRFAVVVWVILVIAAGSGIREAYLAPRSRPPRTDRPVARPGASAGVTG